jgi:acyl-CoA reductase-like NAD-dependent aldehyde dehydrogenase
VTNVHGSLIDGGEVGSDQIFDTYDPSQGDVALASFAAADAVIVESAVTAARAAQPGWEMLGPIARGAVLRRLAGALESEAEHLAGEIAAEVGKPVTEAAAEVARSVVTLYYVAEQGRLPVGEHYVSDNPAAMILTARRPLGAVGIITPWNFPLNLPVWKIAPALLWGNTVVWKPAEQSPLVARHLAALFAEVGLPAGVLNTVFGAAETGAAVASEPGLAAISFTGSTAVGGVRGVAPARPGPRFQAELGGKNPMIVLGDADLERAADLVVAGGTSFGGQKCSATSRLIVDASVADALSERILERFEQLRVGNALDADSQIGPLIDEAARVRALGAISDATASGAELLGGGQPLDRPGWFMKPALLEVWSPGADLAQREIFAPVIALHRATSTDHAIELANDSAYGFFVGVCSRQLDALVRLAPRLQFGIVRLNHVTSGADPHVPFGGWHASGNGRPEQGLAAREFYTQTQTIYAQ